ncbi:MAG: hypothetical protein WBF03_13120 [Xanthobacteraceae bacterium]
MAKKEIKRENPYQPTTRECAILLVGLIDVKQTEADKQVTRTRLSEATLRKLWCRSRLTTEFVHEVQEWLFMAGWVLFFAGTTYAMINVRVVDAWMRISSKRMAEDIAKVQRGEFEFADREKLLRRTEERAEDSEDA